MKKEIVQSVIIGVSIIAGFYIHGLTLKDIGRYVPDVSRQLNVFDTKTGTTYVANGRANIKMPDGTTYEGINYRPITEGPASIK